MGKKGYFDICRLLTDKILAYNIEELNPKDNNGQTPLDLAVKTSDWMVPLDFRKRENELLIPSANFYELCDCVISDDHDYSDGYGYDGYNDSDSDSDDDNDCYYKDGYGRVH